MFNWLQRRITAAVLNGFADAIETLEASQPHAEPLQLPEPLRLRLEAQAEPESNGKVKARSPRKES